MDIFGGHYSAYHKGYPRKASLNLSKGLNEIKKQSPKTNMLISKEKVSAKAGEGGVGSCLVCSRKSEQDSVAGVESSSWEYE